MKVPENIEDLGVDFSPYQYPHLPLGFHPLGVSELGNGDVFGLYWPIGKEDHFPIVCETIHDEYSLNPIFGNVDSFAKQAREHDFRWFEAEPDDEAPIKVYQTARQRQKPDVADEALKLLKILAERFPEYGEANNLRTQILRRLGNVDQMTRAAISTFISPPCFGGADDKTIYLFKSVDTAPANIRKNPLFVRRKELDWKFGGKKTNVTYEILIDSLSYFEDIEDYVSASSLAQAYVQRISSETDSFQDRYKFDLQDMIKRQRKLASLLPSGTRELSH